MRRARILRALRLEARQLTRELEHVRRAIAALDPPKGERMRRKPPAAALYASKETVQ